MDDSLQAGYELLDFGNGRKLERFGPYTLDRPCPAAEGIPPRLNEPWAGAAARFERGQNLRGQWTCRVDFPPSWRIELGQISFELRLTESGQVGIFPEQVDNWRWIGEQTRRAGRPLKVLNLFAYTGGSTLAAAAAGAEVVHVDAAANVVAWARRNAAASNLAKAPIRWIVEDAIKYVGRELKRGNCYDAIVLDPPSYGHGPRGQTWKLDSHLDDLLSNCFELMSPRGAFLLITCHSGLFTNAAALLDYMIMRKPDARRLGTTSAQELSVCSLTGDRLNCGAGVRWSGAEASDLSGSTEGGAPWRATNHSWQSKA